ncbi:hypothetical protein QIT55_gp44 [Nitrosopumilus spindle-shaped virus]|uniref:Uncharacterized protein n=1 Tax=Nitrosopumilus spindle-shaped virus 1 TaxID=2848002 RepID=A0A514K316_9VIRU|nr:hypothetical protein QIT55_gp44 [Nitrosopumilus spindle-shaped virus]QDI74030.1 hypothetical protein [Nitrosopumilus spindle-shaped virus]
MITEFIIKLKIKRKLKELRRLEKIRNLKEDLQILNQDIRTTEKEISELNKVLKEDDKESKGKFEILDESIFNRCTKCHTIYLKSEKHNCF